MKLSFKQHGETAPARLSLAAIALAGLAGLWVSNLGPLLAAAPVGRALQALARLGWTVIHPVAWVLALLVIAVWLATLARAWRS